MDKTTYNSTFFLIFFCNLILNFTPGFSYNIDCLKCHPLDDKKINVHLIPHSHNDVGWVKTLDEYYYGVNPGNTSVSLIISSVVDALKKNSDRRYIQVETAFFHKWWEEHENMREDFKKLVDEGQIEMVNGAWAMNDEACVNYQSIIDQFTLGLRKIEETVGKCGRPRIGWQIDPFGHSREHASILAQMGFDGVFFARMDHDDKDQRMKEGDLNFLWKGSANIDSSVIFGCCFPTALYNEPDWFCWDILCGDDQIVDNPSSPLYNLKDKVEQFSKEIRKYLTSYPSDYKNIIIPMGGDFQYQLAEYNFANMDKLIKGFQMYSTKYNLIYSTPSCYLKAVNDDNKPLKLKEDDFFPYSDRDHAFWAGYFTSRPTLKRFERMSHNILQVMKQLHSLSSLKLYYDSLEDLKQALGVLQHHDAITGTEQQHVSDDYVRMLTAGVETAEDKVGFFIWNILNTTDCFHFSSCLLSNMSICHKTQTNDKFVVLVYNPLGWKTTHYVRLPVESGDYSYEVKGPDGTELSDFIPTLYSFDYVNITDQKPSSHELVFAAKDIPPLGFKVYYIEKVKKKNQKSLGTDFTVFQIDKVTNLLKSVTLNNITVNMSQNFYFYKSHEGLGEVPVGSGAYLFRPVGEAVEVPNASIVYEYHGDVVEEVHQRWDNKYADVYQSIRWYKNENYLEFNWIIGDINLDEMAVGKEFITRFTIDNFNNSNTFYTDSNGRELIKRVKNQRPTYAYNASQEPVASNYYPVTSRIVIRDEKQDLEVAILTDRSQGGTSLKENEAELMVHRRLIFDDDRGVGESLNEVEFGKGLYARGSHYLMLGSGKSSKVEQRILAQKKLLEPWVGLASVDSTFEELQKSMDFKFSGLSEELPENVNIITFEPWIDDDTYLLRFEHILEQNEDSVLSNSVTIPSVENLFSNFKLYKKTETLLAGQLTIDEFNERSKYTWNTVDKKYETKERKVDDDNDEIILNPMEIRTFIVEKKKMSNSGNNNVSNFLLSVLLLIFTVYYN